MLRRLITALKIKWRYKAIPTYSISRQYRDQHDPNNSDFIYGELSIFDFLNILALLQPKPGCKFLDLGAGDGKLVLAAGLYFKNIEAVGIELVASLVQAGVGIIRKCQSTLVKNQSQVWLLHHDFLDFDLKNTHILYINGAAWQQNTWDSLMKKLEFLDSGLHLVSIARKIEHPKFQLHQAISCKASWGKAMAYLYVLS